MAHLVNGHKVHYVYGEEEVTFFHKGKQLTETKPTITCVISRNDEPLVTAKVKPHHEDVNSRIVGRFYAFKKAVRQFPDKAFRKALFNDYLEHCKMP